MKNMVRSLLFIFAATVSALGQTGTAVPELASLDRALVNILHKYHVPGAAVSIAKDGKLVYSRGFGVADITTGEPVQPDSVFRVASLSKPVTSIGVMKLVEEGKISLDTKVLPFIGRQSNVDARWEQITVRNLLQHTGGLDIDFWGFDPSFPDKKTLDSLGVNLPPTRNDVLTFVLANLPLASDPGTKYVYSNVGFMFLTEVIEKASGQKYETYMREKVLAPMGIERMRIGGSLLTQRYPGEVRYWDENHVDAPIFPGLPATVPLPYGTFNLRIFESGGGWVATTPDLVRFLTAVDGTTKGSPLRPETLKLITQRPSYASPTAKAWYGLGWQITETPRGERWDHDGGLQGTASWMFRGVNGISFAVVANHLPDYDQIEAFFNDVEVGLFENVTTIKNWPSQDQFANYFPGSGPRISDGGVVNAASLRPGPVAPGSVVRVYGVNLNHGYVLINGSRVKTQWSESGDLIVRVPRSAYGKLRFEVMNHGRNSNVVEVPVKEDAPGIFTESGNGYGLALTTNDDCLQTSRRYHSKSDSLKAIFVTGADRPTVTVGGLPATIIPNRFPRYMPNGVQTILIRIPSGLKAGDQQLVVSSGGVQSQKEVTLTIP